MLEDVPPLVGGPGGDDVAERLLGHVHGQDGGEQERLKEEVGQQRHHREQAELLRKREEREETRDVEFNYCHMYKDDSVHGICSQEHS